jgi:hypothetical protein
MKIISKAESMKLLEATLRERALEKFAAQLASADAETKRKIMLQVDDDVARELKKYSDESFPEDFIIH